jgi:hypothetical protein
VRWFCVALAIVGCPIGNACPGPVGCQRLAGRMLAEMSDESSSDDEERFTRMRPSATSKKVAFVGHRDTTSMEYGFTRAANASTVLEGSDVRRVASCSSELDKHRLPVFECDCN